MSSANAGGILERLSAIDFKRSLAHVFPGFLLYVGLIMASDAFLSHSQDLTGVFFAPATNSDLLITLIIVGLFVGSILGVMIDGIAHWAFEERWFNKIVKTHRLSEEDEFTIGDAQDEVFKEWMEFHKIHEGEQDKTKWAKSQEYLYPFTYSGDEVKVDLRDNLIREFYSYFEFYLNSALSLVVIAFIIPFYAVAFLHASYLVAIAVCGGFLAGCLLLLFAAIHTLADYKRARLESIEGYLRKKKNEGDESKKPGEPECGA